MARETIDRSKLNPIGFVGLDIIYLYEDKPNTHEKLVVVGPTSNQIIRLGSLARFRPYDEIVLIGDSNG